MSEEYEVNVQLVTVGQPDNSGKLLRGYGTGAIRRYLQDPTLTDTERNHLNQLERKVQKVNTDQGLIYVANYAEPHLWSAKYTNSGGADPLSTGYIKFWDPAAEGEYDSIVLRVRNPAIVYEHDITQAFTQNRGNPNDRNSALRDIFSNFEDSRSIKPSVEIALVKRDDKSIANQAARIRWEWNTNHQKVVTMGYVQGNNVDAMGRSKRREDVIPDKVPGFRTQEVPIVSFARMRNAVILQAAS